MTARKPSRNQIAILTNAQKERRLDYGRPSSMSAAGGWESAIESCRRRGWLDEYDALTADGRAALA